MDHGANIHVKDNRGQTPVHLAASHIETVKLLLSDKRADPNLADNKGRSVRDLLKRAWSQQMEENILSSYSSDENYNNIFISIALSLNKDDFLIKFIKKVSQKKGKLVDSFLTKDAGDISNFLGFIGRHVRRNERGLLVASDQNIKMLIGGEREDRFYLVKTEAFGAETGDKSGDRSLLQYIVDNGVRMMKQREKSPKIPRKDLT